MIHSSWHPLRAAYYSHLEVVRLLLKTDKDEVDTKDKSGWTPLSKATNYGHPQVVKFPV
jgi:ankyrin repeat protein